MKLYNIVDNLVSIACQYNILIEDMKEVSRLQSKAAKLISSCACHVGNKNEQNQRKLHY